MHPPAEESEPDASRGSDFPREVPGFRLVRELGRGGMGVVYEAEEAHSGRVVALKVLARELSVSEEAFSRFQREARLAGAISDANCVFVYGAHQIDGSPAISMELVGGETVEDRLRREEPIPIQTAVGWAIEVLDGLEAAHEVGVVHRDVKPSNCFLSADGHVKIGDFGLARTLERDVQLTQSGAFLGSPLYASPEQVRGRTLDLRSDLYSAAATLYAMLTGSAPFSGGSVGEVLARILSESPPAPRTLRPEIPRGLERVVLKAMSRDPSGRYKSYAAFRDALAPFAGADLRPGRPGLRLVAMFLDSVPLGLLNAAFTMSTGMRYMDADRPWIIGSPLVVAGLFTAPIVYFTLFEGFLGASPGKWVVGQRVLPVGSGQPSLPRALLRACTYYSAAFLSYVLQVALPVQEQYLGSLIAFVLPIAAYLLLFVTARRRNGWRAVHELVSGTRTTQRPSPFQRFRPSESPLQTPVRAEEGVPDEVGGYTIEGALGATPEGRMLRGRDPHLDRSVWMHERKLAGRSEAPRHEGRPARLRWLTSVVQGELTYDVFEDPGGVAVTALRTSAGPPPWQLARRHLKALADELAVLEAEEDTGLSLDQVWIDRAWKIRVLDSPIGSDCAAPRPAAEVMSAFANLLLGAGGEAEASLPHDLPAHAEPTVRRLLAGPGSFETVAALRDELAEWEGRPATLSRNLRAAQLALSAALPALGLLMSLLMVTIVFVIIREVGPGQTLIRQIADAELHAAAGAEDAPAPPTGDLLKAHQILIADAFGDQWSPLVAQNFEGRRAEILEEALAAYPDPTREDIVWARDQFASTGRGLPTSGDIGNKLAIMLVPMTVATCLLWLLFAPIASILLRGGLSFRLTSIRIRSRTGALASRRRCLVRCLVGGVPAVIVIGSGIMALATDQPVVWVSVTGLGVAIGVAGIAYAMFGSGPSVQDRIAGTRLVPR